MDILRGRPDKLCVMNESESHSSRDVDDLIRRAVSGDEVARGELFALHRLRLRRMVQLRMDRRLQGRLDPSDVLQETFLDFSRRLPEYVESQSMPFFVWLRLLTGQKLTDLHRRHLGAKMRTTTKEVSLHVRTVPMASTISLAAGLLAGLPSPSQAVSFEETKQLVQKALNEMDEIDRETLTLRHFEGLTNSETALVLGLKKSAASNRYIRALKRLKTVVETVPGLVDDSLQ